MQSFPDHDWLSLFQRIYGRLGLKPDEDLIAIYEKLALGDGEFSKTSQLFRVKVSR